MGWVSVREPKEKCLYIHRYFLCSQGHLLLFFSFGLWDFILCWAFRGCLCLEPPVMSWLSWAQSLSPHHILRGTRFKLCSWTSWGRANSGNRLWNPGVSVPPSSGGGEKLKFCQSEECYFGSCASHSRRNWTHSPVFCEKYINDKGLWKIILQFVAWSFPQWWEFFPAFFLGRKLTRILISTVWTIVLS